MKSFFFINCDTMRSLSTDFLSNSTVPPSIEHEGTVVDTKVKEKYNITLTCEVSGKYLNECTNI